jgi:hypothetical protein
VPNIIVIGASAGGVEPIMELVGERWRKPEEKADEIA